MTTASTRGALRADRRQRLWVLWNAQSHDSGLADGEDERLDRRSKHTSHTTARSADILRPAVFDHIATLVKRLAHIHGAMVAFSTSNSRIKGWGWNVATLPTNLHSSDGKHVHVVDTCAAWATVCGDQVLHSGRHYWSVQLVRCKNMNVEIGVVASPGSTATTTTTTATTTMTMTTATAAAASSITTGRLRSQAATVERWFPCAQTGALFSTLGQRRVLCDKLEQGSTLSFLLDLDNHGLLFMYLNDKPLGLAFSGLRPPLIPAIFLYDLHDQVVLCVHNRIDPICNLPLLQHPVFDTSRCRGIRTTDARSIVVGVTEWQTTITTGTISLGDAKLRSCAVTWGIRIDSAIGLDRLVVGIVLAPITRDYHCKSFAEMPVGTASGLWLGRRSVCAIVGSGRPESPPPPSSGGLGRAHSVSALSPPASAPMFLSQGVRVGDEILFDCQVGKVSGRIMRDQDTLASDTINAIGEAHLAVRFL